MQRRILFVLFAEDGCRQAHALRYAMNLHRDGHEVRLILEGPATGLLARLEDPGDAVSSMVLEAQASGILAGACRRAAGGCGSDGDDGPAVAAARSRGIGLLDGMDGHADIGPYIRDGFEIVVL